MNITKTEDASESISLNLIDLNGRLWTIPAEVVKTKMKDQNFALHKSLDLYDNAWVVTHVETGAIVYTDNLKNAAVAIAAKKINGMTIKKFNEAVEKIQEIRRELESERRAEFIAQHLNGK
ncbi:hypothetical protein [Undibacterium crateris]|uniref:hypothetical protein n=1 Tax=Undibacterium crateris TaxID=2528175 RepID=UPI00138A329F|nr:hypothetical protein [Undibacterium crateris]NDI85126.1 hypothetical protein [Undibacterium crateris]